MDIATIVALILKEGIPVAMKLWQLWTTGAQITQADWDQLAAMGKVTARDNMLLALARAGIDPNSPQGIAFLGLTPANITPMATPVTVTTTVEVPAAAPAAPAPA